MLAVPLSRDQLLYADLLAEARRLRALHIADLNEQIIEDCAMCQAAWLPEFYRKVSQREPISTEDIENYGSIPDGYVIEDFGRDWWIFKGN